MLIRPLALILVLACIGLAQTPITVGNKKISLRFELDSRGMNLAGIRNNVTHIEHLVKPSPLFEVSTGGPTLSNLTLSSNGGMLVDSSARSKDGLTLNVSACHAVAPPLRFTIEITVPRHESIALMRLCMTNTGQTRMLIRALIPKLG